MACKLDIPLHGTSVHIVRQCGPALGDVLQSKFGCVATFDGVDFERDPSTAQQRGPTVVPEKRFSAKINGGVEVSVWRADLASFPVDAVVNAANEGLQHSGGLARALSNAGGPGIQKESDDYIKRNGFLQTGDAIVLAPCLLPCKNIIHAVGPRLPRNPTTSDVAGAKHLLERAIKSILDKVKEKHLQSVAIPAISSGIFNYPLPECAHTIVTSVKRYYGNFSGRFPEEIRLVNHDEPTVKEMERACRQLLPHGRSGGAAKSSTTPFVQLGNVLLTLKTGKIEEQQTDVIVNTASTQRDLKVGQVSQALLQKAGHGMQQEIYKAPVSGHVIITKPYKLQCKQVFHTYCMEKGKDLAQQLAAQQNLSMSILECLWMAATNKHKSISFPAIGTGALGFDKKEVAHIMSNAVSDFAQKFPEKMEVTFVIFPSDNSTYKAFEEQMGHLRNSASHPSFTQAMDTVMSSSPAFEHRDGSRAPTPQISLNGPSNETTREAERWLSGLIFKSSGTVVICNNFIQHFGEQEHLQLSRLTKKGVSIEEFFEKGHAGIIVSGESNEDVVVAGLQVEAMLCNIQREFVEEEVCAMLPAVMTENVFFERKAVDKSSKEFLSKLATFKNYGLLICKVDKVENPSLEVIFEMKKKQLRCSTSPRTMLQRIPAQFCEMVSHIGFHAAYAPPDDPAYGEGIYFAGKVKTAMEVWKEQMERKEEYLYFVEAKVLTGNTISGKPGLILPPAVGTDPQTVYDSVSGGADIAVIFSGYQALPTYIITCKMV